MTRNNSTLNNPVPKIVKERRVNSKLGKGVWHFDRKIGPPSIGGTCPGASEWCAGVEERNDYASPLKERRGNCYAGKGHFLFPTVQARLDENTAALNIPSLDVVPPRAPFRLHVAGDFDTVGYTSDWNDALSNRPDIPSWFYSRSHAADPKLAAAVRDLSTLNNVQGFASVDETMPTVPDWDRIAYGPNDDRYDPATTLNCPALVLKQSKRGRISCKECQFCFKPAMNDIVNVRWTYTH